AGITVHGTLGGQVGNGGLPLIVQGVVIADKSDQTISLVGSSVANQGTLRASGVGRMVTQALANSGTVQVDSGSTFTLTGTTTYSAASHFTGTGALVLNGTLDGAGTVLTLDATLQLQNGTLLNSTVQGAGGILINGGGNFDSVAVSVPVTVQDANVL